MPVRGFILPTTTQWAGSVSATPSAFDVTALAATDAADVIVVLAKPKPVSDTQFVSVPAWAGVSCGWTLGVLSSFPPQPESRTAKQAAGIAARKENRFDAAVVGVFRVMSVSDASVEVAPSEPKGTHSGR